MKKSVLSLILVFAMTLGASAQAPQPKPEDLMKNVVQVEKTQPVPEKMKAGFDLITGKDSLALLTLHFVRPSGRPGDRDARHPAGRRIRGVPVLALEGPACRRHASPGLSRAWDAATCPKLLPQRSISRSSP